MDELSPRRLTILLLVRSMDTRLCHGRVHGIEATLESNVDPDDPNSAGQSLRRGRLKANSQEVMWLSRRLRRRIRGSSCGQALN